MRKEEPQIIKYRKTKVVALSFVLALWIFVLYSGLLDRVFK
jgi:hypothetical protein